MFKLESYITPIILSQVERYVKNIKTEDSKVSLWGGDAVFNNLDLRLDVLENELHLPFSLVSGHIHELQIHVPWTRLNTEPIVVTINTIECVLKLPSDKATSVSGSDDTVESTENSKQNEERRKSKRKNDNEAAPPGYIQSLVNKIISNIQIVCNNLILKYVEDDLVLSLNVRTVSYSSCNESWRPSFTELSLPDLILRKVLSVSDLTICLDRRGTTGKIEVYQDPLLYRCSMTLRLSWCYKALTSKTPFKTVINLLADKMDFSMTGLQVPLVVRLFKLFLAFYYGDMIPKHEIARRRSKPVDNDCVIDMGQDDEEEGEDASLGSYLWDVGSSIGTALLPVYWEDEDNPEGSQQQTSTKLSSILGFYIKEATLTLKLAANIKQKGFYRGGKQCFNSYLLCKMHGFYSEVTSRGTTWANVQCGVSQMCITPVGSHPDTVPHYLMLGAESNKFLGMSLFAPEFGSEEGSKPRELLGLEEPSWEQHCDTVTETAMLDRAPALGMDYLYTIDIPADLASEDLSELEADLENSNLSERALCRVVLGPAQVHVTQGLVSRVNIVSDLITEYEYVPYVEPSQPPGPDNLTLPTKEEVDNLESNSPVRVYRILMMHPSVVLHGQHDTLEIGLRSLELGHQAPMYPLRNVKAACLMHPPSKVIMNNCHSSFSIQLSDSWIKLNSEKIASIDKLSVHFKTILYQNFWKGLYQKLGEASTKCDTFQASISMPTVVIIQNMLSHLQTKTHQEYSELVDMMRSCPNPTIATTMCGLHVGLSWTKELITSSVSIDGAAASLKPHEAHMKSIPIFNGICHKNHNRNLTMSSSGQSPGKALLDMSSSKYLSATFQLPSETLPHHVPTLVNINLGESFLLCDPKLADFLKFGMQYLNISNNMNNTNLNTSNSSIKSGEIKERAKSGSVPPVGTKTEISLLQSLTGAVVDIKSGTTNFYISDRTMSTVAGHNVSETVIKAAKSKKEYHVINVQLSSINVCNANIKVDLSQFSQHPILFPPSVWTVGKVNFPWDISLAGFSAGKLVDNYITEILLPVNTSCSLGSSVHDVSRSLAIHVDMSSVQFILSTSIMTSVAMISQTWLAAVLECLPSHANTVATSPTRRQRVSQSSASQHLVLRSVGSVSEPTQVTSSAVFSASSGPRSEVTPDTWSVWLQWAIPQCSVALTTAKAGGLHTKLNIMFEDTSVSVDKQSSYTKFKFRVRSVNGELLSSSSVDPQADFKPKNFPDQVISCHPNVIKTLYVFNPESGGVEIISDEDDVDINNLPKGVFNLTITKAECQNMMKKIKSSSKDNKLGMEMSNTQQKRFLTEFDFEINPIDFFLETSILETILSVLYPLACIKLPKVENSKASTRDALLQLNNNTLPMVYFKSERIRVFFQSPKDNGDDLVPNFVLFQLKKAKVTSQVENPLTRILVNPGLYHQASNSKMLSVPGSPVEDRQYQVDVVGVSIATGHWQDVVDRNKKPVKPLLRTMSENPALEWNTNIQSSDETNDVVLVPILFNVSIKTMFAPAIIHQTIVNNTVNDNLVAGISLEVNVMSDVNLCLSVQQLSFMTSVQQEIYSFFKFDSTNQERVPKCSDSGLDSIKEDESFKSVDNSLVEADFVPCELLVTCTNVRMILHKYEKSNASVTGEDVRLWRRYHHAHRVSTKLSTLSDDVTEETDDEREERNVLTDPVPVDTMSNTGYEGSDDESTAEKQSELKIRLIPLLSVCMTHPYTMVSVTHTAQKLDISLYNMTIACSPQGFHLPAKSGKKVPWLRDFPLMLFETKPGKPDAKSSVYPSLVTLSIHDFLSKVISIKCVLLKPVLTSVSQERCSQMMKIIEELKRFRTKSNEVEVVCPSISQSSNENLFIKEVVIETKQMMCRYDCKQSNRQYAVKGNIGEAKLKLQMNQLTNDASAECCLNLRRLSSVLLLNSFPNTLLDPCNIEIIAMKQALFLDISRDLNIKVKMTNCNVHVGPNHLHCMDVLKSNIFEMIGKSKANDEESISEDFEAKCQEPILTDTDVEELHFQDDLRAGAFQFVEAGDNHQPSPYQVVFARNSLTWKYPQRRTLTKVVIFPLPFMEASDLSADMEDGVDCELLYFSETLQHFVVYQSFQLSESKVLHLDLPLVRDKKLCASSSMWQVRINRCGDQAFITPQALLSVLKVDSFSSPKLLPQSQLSVCVSSLKVVLHNQLQFAGKKLSGEMSDLGLDSNIPDDHPFMSLSLSPLSVGVSVWPEERSTQLLQYSIKAKLSVEVVDYAFLGVHHVIKPVDTDLWIQQQDAQLDVTAKIGSVDASAGPFLLHTLRQSSKVWGQVVSRLDGNDSDAALVLLTHVMVINETGQVVKFGQADTDEEIVLQPKNCSMYCWRTNKASQKLKLSLTGQDWSEPFGLNNYGTRLLKIDSGVSDICSSVILDIERKSPTFTVVRFSGLLNILNLLKDHLELRILSGNSKEVRCLIGSYCRPTSVVSWCSGAVLKIRLFGLSTPWSGDIPLEAVVGKRKSFMVKLPLKDKMGSTTIWCTILTEDLAGDIRKLVIFSPMYVIQSQLPGEITTIIDNTELPREIGVKGLGNMEQLDISGAPENKFGLSFKLGPELPASSPPLSISWGIVDQIRDKSAPVISINDAIKTSFSYNLKSVQSSGMMKEIQNMKMSEQPNTNCKVTFHQYHPAANTLCVRIQPHNLIINKTDIPILTKMDGNSCWLIEAGSVFHPPPLANNKFYLGMMSEDGQERWGTPLELADSDWTYLSIRPNVQGILHRHGTLSYKLQSADNFYSYITLVSSVSEGIRVITIKPSFIVNNQSLTKFNIKPSVLSGRLKKSDSRLSADVKSYISTEEAITPISFWTGVGKIEDGDQHFVISLSVEQGHWSGDYPVPQDADTRLCVTVPHPSSQEAANMPLILMTQRADSQVFIIIKDDTRPQVKLNNLLSTCLLFKEEGSKKYEDIKDNQSLYVTMPWLTKGFPYVEQHKDGRRLQFSLENNGWSAGVDITASHETFINLPGFGDVRVTVECLQPTTHIYIEHVSHLEVAARDIRARFECPPMSPMSPVASPVSTVYVTPSMTPNTSLLLSANTTTETDQFSDCQTMIRSSSRRPSTSSSFSIIAKPIKNHPAHFIEIKCKEWSLAITDDLCFEDDFQEILRMTFSHIDIKCRPRTDYATVFKTLGGEHPAQLDVDIKIGDFQVDNQMFKRGLYHFPVLLSSQDAMRGQKSEELINAKMIFNIAGGTFYSQDFRLRCQPMTLNVEDVLFYKLQEYLSIFSASVNVSDGTEDSEPGSSSIPENVILATESASQLIFFNKVSIEEISLQVSAHASLKLFVGLEDSKINLSKFENQAVWSTWYSFGHRLSMHYLSGALFKAGWVVGSLDMIGSPAGFTRNVSDGVRDFVSLPYNGIWNGPWGFIVGLSQGSSSLVKHVSAGTLTSITNFASSMSRNLDRLSFDREHMTRNEEVRRLKPQGLGEGLVNGLSGVGISLLGAIGGLAHHPIQVLLEDGVSPVKLIGGVGRGMVGVVTKPLGSAAELIAQTGHGMLSGTGWTKSRRPRLHSMPTLVLDLASSRLKYQWKVSLDSSVATIAEASLFEDEQYIAVSLILSKDGLHIVNEEEDAIRDVFGIQEVTFIDTPSDPTLLVLELIRNDFTEKYEHVSDRVARFVLESINFSEQGLAPDLQSSSEFSDNKKLLFYMSPDKRIEFCTVFQQVKEENQKFGFPVMF